MSGLADMNSFMISRRSSSDSNMELRRSPPSVVLRRKWSSHSVFRQLQLLLLVLFVLLVPSESRPISPPASFSPLQQDSFWVSDNALYTFGFKPLPPSSSASSSSATKPLYLLCIWRTADPNLTALWWPSLLSPINASSSSSNSLDPSVTDSATLLYSRNGTLQLHRSNGTTSSSIWTSSNPTSIYADMADSGNLRLLLLDNTSRLNGTASSSNDHVAWQSFYDSRNSIILGQGLSYDMKSSTLIRSKTNSSSYVPGSFSLVFQSSYDSGIFVELHGFDAFNNVYIYLVARFQISKDHFSIRADAINEYDSRQNGTVTVDQRLTLDDDGNLRVYIWEPLGLDNMYRSTNGSSQNATSSTGSWKQVWEFLSKCRTGSPCGPFGICSDVGSHSMNCSCPEPYYHARSSNGDWTDGCVADSKNTLQYSYNCTNGNDAASSANPTHDYTVSYLKLPRIDYYYFDLNHTLDVDDAEKCQKLCLDRCDCLAATYLSVQKVCYIKRSETGYLLNGQVSDEEHTTFLKVMVPATSSGHGSKLRRWGYIAISLALLGSVTIFVIMIYNWRKRRCSRGRKLGESPARGAPVRYEYVEIAKATGDFSEKLGEGGFGIVYKGRVLRTNKRVNDEGAAEAEVAVKVLKKAPQQQSRSSGYLWSKRRTAENEKQFRAEVGTLGKIHHVNLVGLLGYCVEDVEDEEEENDAKRSIQRSWRSSGGQKKKKKKSRVLVYELVGGGSLDKYLIPLPMKPEPLPWEVRLSIAVGTARGIAYLHHACDPPIIHCDIKPQNLLLDQNFTPKVADFGFAKQLDDSTLIVTQKCGTHGYMAPEWFKGHAITAKVDVFSFGKLLLELVHGFKLRPQEEDGTMPLSEWAFLCISQDALLPLAGGGEGMYDPWAHQKLLVLKVALWCIQPVRGNRPAMARVVQLLENVRGSAAGIL